MPRQYTFEGHTFTVPDNATMDQVQDYVRAQGWAPAPSTDPSGRTPTGEPAPNDTRNGVQRYLDNLITPDPRREEWQTPFRNGVDDFAQHVASNVVPLISHPLDSAKGMLKSVGTAIANGQGSPTGVGGELLRPLIEKAVQDYQAHGPVRGTTDLLGTGTGALATGELGGQAIAPIVRGVSRVAAPLLENTGLDLGNAALGARGPKPFKYGANPARGAYEQGVLPSISKSSAAKNVEAALPQVGERISKGVEQGNPVPLSNISESIESPIRSAKGIIEGPGGANRSAEPLNALQESMTHQAPGAAQPIYGPRLQPTQFFPDASASDVWHTVRNIDANTRFNPDPEVEGLNEVRRSIRGGLRGNLEEAAPQIAAPSQTYSDLMSAQDALDRTMHSGTSVGKLLSVPMTPIESTLGAGLYNAGKTLGRIGASSYTPLLPVLPQQGAQ